MKKNIIFFDVETNGKMGSSVLSISAIKVSYDFEKNKGYGTKKHVEAIKTKGVLKNVHRKVFLRKILDETKDEPKEVQLRIL